MQEGLMEIKNHNNDSSNNFYSEVMYHIFLRSFYDSNGDHIGDLNGVKEKLDYMQDLGVTSILVTPIVQSVYYHNYFADNFKKIDPGYGTMQDWMSLVKAIHQRGMKIYLDQEFQYVTINQKWFKDSYENPESRYSDYIIYRDSLNQDPEPIIYDISILKGYNDSTRRVATVNLNNPKVFEYFFRLLKFWIDPDGDGNFEEGVDGFRLDHMMDDLDHKGIQTDLFSHFWCPLIDKLKAVNPKIKFIAEQADWTDFGADYFEKGCVDRVFGFNLRNAIVSFNKQQISTAADSTFNQVPKGGKQIVFIENHDMERYASAVDNNPGKLHVGAAFNLLIGGIPSVYYGQELGMYGKGGFGKYGLTDGNDIPHREAFKWYKIDSGEGMALWYKDTGPWWDDSSLKPDDGLSLQEEIRDSDSLWHYYKELIHLHTSNAALTKGKYSEMKNDNEEVFSFVRYTSDSRVAVVINLSDTDQSVAIDLKGEGMEWQENNKLVNLFGEGHVEIKDEKIVLELPAFFTRVWGVE